MLIKDLFGYLLLRSCFELRRFMVGLLIDIGCDHKLESWRSVAIHNSHIVKPFRNCLRNPVFLMTGNGRSGCQGSNG